MQQLDWGGLRVVLALARAGSFGAAARQLAVDRVTVMRRLDAIEAELDVRLFDRARDGCRLTERGEHVLPALQEMEDAATSVELRLAGGDASLEGPVRVTAPEWLGYGVLVPELARLRAQHPGIAVELITTNQILSLTRREADIAIRNVRPTQKNLVLHSVGPFAFGLYAARTYLAERGVPGDWAKHDILLADEDSAYMPGQAWLVEHAAAARIAFRASEVLPLAAAARAGMGITALPCILGETDPGLARVPPGVVSSFDVWMVLHPDLRRAARVRVVVDFLRGIFTAQRAQLRGTHVKKKR